MRKRLRSREEAPEDEQMETTNQVRSNSSDEGEKILKRKRVISSSPPCPPHPPTEPSQRTRRSMRRSKTICSCTSPTPTFLNAHSTFSWYEKDLWTEISKYLDGRSLVMLSATNRWFNRQIMEECIWKYICLRDLQISGPCNVSFRWIDLYASAFNGSHSFMFRQQEKHIDWMRIGAFALDSSMAFLTEKLIAPINVSDGDAQKAVETDGCCILNNVKTGIWIADLQLVRCPVCDLNTCDGTMQTLDARHIELFLSEGFRDESWDYEVIGSHDIKTHVDGASGAILDVKHMDKSSTSAVFNTNSWIGKPMDWQPRAVITLHGVAVNTNLQKNDGLHVKYQAMRAGAEGEVVSIRISQQLL